MQAAHSDVAGDSSRIGGAAAGGPGSDGACEYAAVPPTPGTLVIFPGWLLHAVLPAAAADTAATADVADDQVRLPRISVAFNWGLPAFAKEGERRTTTEAS